MRWLSKIALLVPLGLIGCEDWQTTGQMGEEEQVGTEQERGVQAGDERDQRIGQPMGDQREAEQRQMEGQLQGTVQSIDRAAGTVKIEAGGETMELNATPMALAGMKENEVANLQYTTHGDQLWVQHKQAGAGDVQGMEGYEGRATVSGEVSNLNPNEGTLKVQDTSLKAHPQMLEQIRQGQTLSVEYVTIDGENWAVNTQTTGGEGVEPQQEQQEGVILGGEEGS